MFLHKSAISSLLSIIILAASLVTNLSIETAASMVPPSGAKGSLSRTGGGFITGYCSRYLDSNGDSNYYSTLTSQNIPEIFEFSNGRATFNLFNVEVGVQITKCISVNTNPNVIKNFIPTSDFHSSSFAFDQISLTSPTLSSTTINNTSPTVKEVVCEGNNTVVRFKDSEYDRLELSTINNGLDFNSSSTIESNGILKVTFSAKNPSFSGTNTPTLYVTENVSLTSGNNFGHYSTYIVGQRQYEIVKGQAAIVEKPTVSKLDLTVKAVCDPVLYNSQPSTSSSSSNSLSSVSKSSSSSSSSANSNSSSQSSSPSSSSSSSSIQTNLKHKMFWRHTNGTNVVWNMDEAQILSGKAINFVTPDWDMAAINDFDSDGNEDILWRNRNNGLNVIWYLDAQSMYKNQLILPTIPTDWQIVASNNLNSDSKPDIMWRNKNNGMNVIWYMNPDGNFGHSNAYVFQTVPTEWNIIGASDVNGDQKPDIVWENKNTSAIVVWNMQSDFKYNGSGFTWVTYSGNYVSAKTTVNLGQHVGLITKEKGSNHTILSMIDKSTGKWLFADYPDTAKEWTPKARN